METGRIIFWAILLALVFRSLVWEPFRIPSNSMAPNLEIGDYILVKKYAYGYSRFSFPFGLPLFRDRIIERPPKRGDIVVFRNPKDSDIVFVKRLVGLPGDKIRLNHGRVYINDVITERTDSGRNWPNWYNSGNCTRLWCDWYVEHVRLYFEVFDNGQRHAILERHDHNPPSPFDKTDNTSTYKVPENHYFMMGDNRDNSSDSRYLQDVGFVPFEHFIGRADRVLFSVDITKRLPRIRMGRFFHGLE